MRTVSFFSAAAIALLACKDADPKTPCERAAANGQRLATKVTAAGETPYSVEQCERDQLTRAQVDCLGYASSWDEFERCAPAQVHASGMR